MFLNTFVIKKAQTSLKNKQKQAKNKIKPFTTKRYTSVFQHIKHNKNSIIILVRLKKRFYQEITFSFLSEKRKKRLQIT